MLFFRWHEKAAGPGMTCLARVNIDGCAMISDANTAAGHRRSLGEKCHAMPGCCSGTLSEMLSVSLLSLFTLDIAGSLINISPRLRHAGDFRRCARRCPGSRSSGECQRHYRRFDDGFRDVLASEIYDALAAGQIMNYE